MPSSETSVPRRWLRLLLVIGTFAAGCAGQYWLSVHHVTAWSAWAWATAALCFVLLYACSPDARVLPSLDDAALSRNVEWVLFTLVFCAGVFFVFFRLSEFPPGLNHDAAWEGMYAIRILNGEPYTSYANEAWGRETGTFYLKALSIWLLGATQRGVEGPSIVAGVLILPFLYWWTRNMFGPRLALMATLLLGVSGWHVITSRTGWRSDVQPLFTAITCCFFIRAMLTAKWWDFALAGAGLGLTLHTYNAARTFPALFGLWLVLVALQSWHWRGFLRRYGNGLAAFVLGFLITAAPLIYVAMTRWHEFTGRMVFLVGSYSLTDNLKIGALLFNYWGNGDDFFTTTPALEFPAAVFLAFGILWLLARWRDERAQFLLLGVAINMVPAIASNPNMNRAIGTMPFIYIVAALGVGFFARELGRLVPRVGPALAAIFLVAVGGAAIYATYVQYFGPERRTVWGYYPETSVLGRYMHGLVPDYVIRVGGANFPRDTLTFLTYQGVGNPERRNYEWIDDPPALLKERIVAPHSKGLAFIMGNDVAGRAVLDELARRYPTHRWEELRYPANGGVFAKALLVPAASEPVMPAPGEPPPVAKELLQDPPGQVRGGRGTAVTASGNALVCDFGNNRIQEFDPQRRFVRQWGHRGDAQGEFRDPCGIAVGPTGEVFVADTWNHRVQVFDTHATFLRGWGGFFSPRGIAVAADGSVFVADSGGNRIVRFSPAGQKEVEWGTKGSATGQFFEPIGVATDAEGRVYVADNGNGRLQVFTRDGTYVSSFKVSGWGSRAYSEPYIALDARGTIWVTVPNDKEVRAYDAKGKLLRTITGQMLATARFEMPMGIAYDAAANQIVVVDLDKGPVRFTP